MKRTIVTSTVIIMIASGSAIAKGHDQGSTEIPGMDVGATTVSAAHTLGSAKGNRPEGKGPAANSPAKANAGR